jgi:hypothetical protein
MSGSPRHRRLARFADSALLGAFLVLCVAAYGGLFFASERIIRSSVRDQQFTDIYQPGRDPWAGILPGGARTDRSLASSGDRGVLAHTH